MQKTVQQDQLDLKLQNQASCQQALRFIITQLAATIVLFVVSLTFDFTIAYSSLTGGLIATLANAWFALKVYRVKPTVTPEILLSTFYVGEIYKFIFTGAMFIMAFVLIKPLNVAALLVTYFLIHMTPVLVNVFSKQTFNSDRDKES
jgi:ATP synthase protein I